MAKTLKQIENAIKLNGKSQKSLEKKLNDAKTQGEKLAKEMDTAKKKAEAAGAKAASAKAKKAPAKKAAKK